MGPAHFEFGALGPDLGDAGFDGCDLRGRAGLAVLPLVALGRDRLQPAVRQFGLARQRLRFGPHLGGDAAMTVNVAANPGEPVFGVETGGNSASAASALSCAVWASAWSAARRLWASDSADFREAWRLTSRSVLA